MDANASSTADGAVNDIASFSSMSFAATILGINFSPSSSNGLSTNTEELAISAQQPGGVTYGDLKFNPLWEALRGDPRFEQIVASLAPKE